ncbi:MAG: hypothetical protein ACPGVI_00180 [Crocinitomicaceae bacterium]
MKLYFSLLCLLFLSFNASTQDSTKVKRVKVLPVPSFGYSPETSGSIGAVCLFTIDAYQDGKTRSSNAKIEGLYTLNRQLIIENEWNYFFREEKWFTQGLIHYSKYPDLYYGIGADADISNEVTFNSDRFRADLHLLRKIKKSFFVGLGIRFNDYSKVAYNDSIIQFPNLYNSRNYGVKVMARLDARNNILTTTKGSYLELVNTVNFGEFTYNNISLDARKYYELGKKKQQVIAGRVFHNSIIGTPNFYDYSLIGGDRLVRGYLYGRFRDQHLSTVQVEYRAHLFWRIGVAGFGGVSLVYPDLNNLSNHNVKPNLGGGLRFLVDRKENTYLRLDYAIGVNRQSGFYVSFGESF